MSSPASYSVCLPPDSSPLVTSPLNLSRLNHLSYLYLAAQRLPPPSPRLLGKALAAAPGRGRRDRQRGFPSQRRARRQRIPASRRRRRRASAALQAGASPSPTAVWLRLWLRIRPDAAAEPALWVCAVQLRPPAAAAAGASVRLRGSEPVRSRAPAAAAAWARGTEFRVPPWRTAAASEAGRLPPTVALCEAEATAPSWYLFSMFATCLLAELCS